MDRVAETSLSKQSILCIGRWLGIPGTTETGHLEILAILHVSALVLRRRAQHAQPDLIIRANAEEINCIKPRHADGAG
jgi:hypothetical protein